MTKRLLSWLLLALVGQLPATCSFAASAPEPAATWAIRGQGQMPVIAADHAVGGFGLVLAAEKGLWESPPRSKPCPSSSAMIPAELRMPLASASLSPSGGAAAGSSIVPMTRRRRAQNRSASSFVVHDAISSEPIGCFEAPERILERPSDALSSDTR
jgi:hypothetical protein